MRKYFMKGLPCIRVVLLLSTLLFMTFFDFSFFRVFLQQFEKSNERTIFVLSIDRKDWKVHSNVILHLIYTLEKEVLKCFPSNNVSLEVLKCQELEKYFFVQIFDLKSAARELEMNNFQTTISTCIVNWVLLFFAIHKICSIYTPKLDILLLMLLVMIMMNDDEMDGKFTNKFLNYRDFSSQKI